MAMRIYRAPNGLYYQFPEGEQPKGYELVKPAAAKRRTAANKSKTAPNK